jgi:hypothetical protein
MPRVKKLLELAKNRYGQAKGSVNAEGKQTLRQLGDKYLREADDLRQSQIVQAAYPKPGAKPGTP